MNITTFEHAGVALSLQLIVLLLTGNPWIGAAFGAALFIGREHTQAEYRWIAKLGAGKRANLPWWGGFDPQVWGRDKLDAWLDWLAPTVSVIMVALFCNHVI